MSIADKQAEKQRKLLRVRIEMAKFLQETVRESGLKAESVVKSDEFKQFFRKVSHNWHIAFRPRLTCRSARLVRNPRKATSFALPSSSTTTLLSTT